MINNKHTKFTSLGEQNILNPVVPVVSLTGGKRLALTSNILYHI